MPEQASTAVSKALDQHLFGSNNPGLLGLKPQELAMIVSAPQATEQPASPRTPQNGDVITGIPEYDES